MEALHSERLHEAAESASKRYESLRCELEAKVAAITSRLSELAVKEGKREQRREQLAAQV